MSFQKALKAIDAAHAEDPRIIEGQPYELVYAKKCSAYLEQIDPEASDILKLAVRAQHFRRWEVPRDSYPMTKPGYFAWRTGLKKRQGELAAKIYLDCGYSQEDVDQLAAIIRKDKIKSNKDTQSLEDVACCVFLEDFFEDFNKEHSDEKIIAILRKTWPKMSERGHEVALTIKMSSTCTEVIQKALA